MLPVYVFKQLAFVNVPEEIQHFDKTLIIHSKANDVLALVLVEVEEVTVFHSGSSRMLFVEFKSLVGCHVIQVFWHFFLLRFKDVFCRSSDQSELFLVI